IGHRVGEGHAQLDDIGPGCGQALEDGQRGVVVRVTGGDEGDQCRAVLLLQFFETALQTAHARLSSRFRWCITVCMSLSPRPDRLTTMMWSFGSFGARLNISARACDDSSAGMMPSRRQQSWKALSASASVIGTYSTRPTSCSQACSGPTPG